MEPYIGNQKAEVEGHWEEWDCYFGKRNYDDFSNWGYMCLTRGYFVGKVKVLHGIGILNSLVSRMTLNSKMALEATHLIQCPNLKHGT